MKSIPRPLLTLLGTLLFGVTNPASATVTADGVVSIDAASTSGTILASAGTVDLALNLGAGSGATINSIAFTGAPLTVATPVVGTGATLTPDAPTGAGTSLRNLDLNGFLWTTTGDFAGVMNDAVDTNRFPAVAGDALNFTITGLDANRFYFIQLLSGDTRSESENQDYTLGGVTQNAQFGDGGSNDGALVKFTATGETTLTLSVSRVAGNSPPMLAGILIRSVEPGLFGPATTVTGTSDGSPSTLTVNIGNGGGTAYDITGASFSGTNPGDFSNGTTLPLAIPASSNADITVDVNPTAAGTRTATLTLTTTDPSAPTIDVDLSVDVTDPDIAIDPSLDFGNTVALPGAVTSDVFVDNNGGATNLTVSAPVITGPGAAAFSVTSLPAPIVPGGSESVEVTFNPLAVGFYAATLELTTNDPFTPTVTVQLSGEVTGDLISPVTVAAVSSENLFGIPRDADNTINGSGMTGLGSAGSTHATGENSQVWTSNGNIAAPNDFTPDITYDLGAVHLVTKIREWGYNSNFQVGIPPVNIALIGPDQVEIFTSTDNVNYASAGTVNFALAPGTASYTGNEIPVALNARYIRFEIKSNHDGAIFDGTPAAPGAIDARALTGLSEVRFEGTLAPTSPFQLWQTANSTAGGAAADHDNDGVSNGVELFIGGPNNTTGFTALPGITGNSVTFTKHAGFTPSTYGTDFVIETSETLTGAWTQETVGGNVSQSGDSFTYTFPPGGPAKKFVRLAVIITP